MDKNNLQIDGLVKEVMNVNIKEEMLACWCDVVEIDGHDFSSLEYGFKEFNKESNKPTVIVMNTKRVKAFLIWKTKHDGMVRLQIKKSTRLLWMNLGALLMNNVATRVSYGEELSELIKE